MSRKYLNDIERSAKKIANINQQLLTLGGRGFYDHEAMDLNETARLALAELGTLPSGVTCEISLNDNIPYIRGGNLQIQRVIQNLLMNATTAIKTEGTIRIKTEQCGIRPMVGAHGEIPGGEYVKLTVSDTGIGISNEMLLKIFDPFFTTKRLDIERGCGLGLSVVDSVIKDHRGYIDIKSQLGEGTDFSIYFPAVKGLAKSQSNAFKHNYGGRETVLVIDDDKILRNVTSISLKKLGYRVTSVESGEAAIEFLKDNPHDILILDMVMPPGIDGTETYRQILKLNPEQRAIIVSGFSSSDKITEALALGVGSFVRKPLNGKMLARALRHELDRIVPQKKMQTSAS